MPTFGQQPADPEFERCLPVTLQFEGGFVDDPADMGGRTNKGITQATYDRACEEWGQPHADVKDITDADVRAIYAEDYWVPSGAVDQPWPMNLLIFDSAVNHGVARAKRWAAQCTSPSNFLDLRTQFYSDIVAAHPSNAKFLHGWLARVSTLRALL
jgi:lysozyme family protein